MNRWALVLCFALLMTLPREGIVSGSTPVSKAQKYYLIYKVTPGFDPDPRFGRGNASAETDYHEEAKRQLERVTPKLDAFIESLIANDNKYKIAPYRAGAAPFDSIYPDPASRNRRLVVILGFHIDMIFLDIPSDAAVSELERELSQFFAEHDASANKNIEPDPRYRLQIQAIDVFPSPFPDDPEESARNAKNVFARVRQREDTQRASAESLYDPLLQEFFSGDHPYRKFVSFIGEVNDKASIDMNLVEPIASALTLYFDKKTPVLLQQIVSYQFLALMGRRNDNFRRWEQHVFADYSTAEVLVQAIEYGFTDHNSRASIAFGPPFMTSAARHRDVVKQLASRELAPAETDPPLRKGWSPDKESTKQSCAIVVARILHNYFSNSQDVPAILADLMNLESHYYLFERERRDALWALFLGLMEDDDYSTYKEDICDTLQAIPPLRMRWAVSSKTLDWSKLPKGAVVQIDGPDPSRAVTALTRTLCRAPSGKAK